MFANDELSFPYGKSFSDLLHLFHSFTTTLSHVSRVMISYLSYSCVVDDRAWCIHLNKIAYAPLTRFEQRLLDMVLRVPAYYAMLALV